MTIEPMPDGYQVCGRGRSWIIERYANGEKVWLSPGYPTKEQADTEMCHLQGEKA